MDHNEAALADLMPTVTVRAPDQGWPTYWTGTLSDRDGGITGIGVNQTVPVPPHGNVSAVDKGWGLL